jgi:hypothetical protein
MEKRSCIHKGDLFYLCSLFLNTFRRAKSFTHVSILKKHKNAQEKFFACWVMPCNVKGWRFYGKRTYTVRSLSVFCVFGSLHINWWPSARDYGCRFVVASVNDFKCYAVVHLKNVLLLPPVIAPWTHYRPNREHNITFLKYTFVTQQPKPEDLQMLYGNVKVFTRSSGKN